MTTTEHTQQPATAPSRALVAPAPRLREVPIRRRRWYWEAIDAVAIRTNRLLDRVPGSRWLHDRVLRSLEVVEVEVPVGGEQTGLDGLRIAFCSDLHAGSYLDSVRLADLFARIRQLQPDLLCLGGDLVNSKLSEVRLYDRALRESEFRFGIHVVAGNHDRRWARDIGVWQDFFEERGVNVLSNHGGRIEHGGASLWLCGVDDLSDGDPDIERALAGRSEADFTLMLAHQPDHFLEIAPHGVDLVLSGHTHAGQVRPFGRAVVCHTEYGLVEGGFEREGARLHVSRGVGATILPIRHRARPEITSVVFRARPGR